MGSQFCLPFFHFAAVLDLGKYYEWMLKVLGRSLMVNRIFPPSQSTISHIITKKKFNFTVKKSGRCYLYEDIKVHLTKIGTNRRVLPGVTHFSSNDVKMYILNLFMTEHQTNPKRNIPQSWPVFLKNVNVMDIFPW